jgi:hypothetical protein
MNELIYDKNMKPSDLEQVMTKLLIFIIFPLISYIPDAILLLFSRLIIWKAKSDIITEDKRSIKNKKGMIAPTRGLVTPPYSLNKNPRKRKINTARLRNNKSQYALP